MPFSQQIATQGARENILFEIQIDYFTFYSIICQSVNTLHLTTELSAY